MSDHHHHEEPASEVVPTPARAISLQRWAMRIIVGVPLLHGAYHLLATAMGWPCP